MRLGPISNEVLSGQILIGAAIAALGEPSSYASRLTPLTADRAGGLPMGGYEISPDRIARVVTRVPDVAPIGLPSVDIFRPAPGAVSAPKPFTGSTLSGWGAPVAEMKDRLGRIRM